MAKKAKKYEAEVATDETQQPQQPEQTMQNATEQTQATEQEQPKQRVAVAKPMFYLEDANGTQYQFTRFPLPKRAEKSPEGEFVVNIDGQEMPAWTTASKGWAADDKVIEYIWLDLPDHDAKGYITLDYNVQAATFDGAEFSVGEGKANRENPVRQPKDADKEENRKILAAQTLAKRKAEAPAEQETQGEQSQQAEG
jgi:hypothetical protein